MKPDLSTYGGLLHDVGYAGGIVDELNVDIINMVNDQAIAVQFGSAVARSAADNTCKAPAADGDKIIGIATRFAIKAVPGYGQTNANVVEFDQYDSVPVLRHGDIYVVAAENVTRGDAALSLTAGNGTIGGVTGGAAGAGRVAIPGATWETTTAAGSVGIVRINN